MGVTISQIILSRSHIHLGIMGFFDEPQRRSLGIRDKQIVWERAEHKCESCAKEITFPEMQVGHKTAYSRGGSTTLKNSVSLCYACNKLQGTDSWTTFQKKLGRQVEGDTSNVREKLNELTLPQLKFLASNHNVKPRAKVVEGWIEDKKLPPGKKQYVNALSKIVTETDIEIAKTTIIEKPVAKKKRRKTSSSWFW